LSPTDIHFKDLSPDFVLSAFPEDVSHIQGNFDLLNDVDFADLGDTMGNEPFENSGLYPHEQPNFLNQLFQEGTTSLPNTNTLVDAASQVTAFQLDDLAGSMPGAPTLLVEGTLQPQVNQILPADFLESNQFNSRSEGAMEPTMMPFGSLAEQIPVPLQTPMALVQTQSFPLNADEKLSCNHSGCESDHFERKCDWQ